MGGPLKERARNAKPSHQIETLPLRRTAAAAMQSANLPRLRAGALMSWSVSDAIAFAQAAPAQAVEPINIAAERAKPPLVLVACCATKRPRRALAADLYVSDLFRKSRAYAEQLGPWRVLSARHHLVRPDQTLAPYNQRLDMMTPAERRSWAALVANLIRVQGFAGRRIVMLAGDLYRRDLIPHLTALDCEVSVPMIGLGIGHQKQWLAQQLEGVAA